MIQERLKELRAQMQERGIDIYIVPTSDFHQSEYVGEYLKLENTSPDLPVLPEQQSSQRTRQDFGQTDVILFRQKNS